jgi:hypothetical protein
MVTRRKRTTTGPVRREGSVVSTARDDGGPAPPLPHETDQALGSAGRTPRRSMKQAHDDLARGLRDTDKAPVMDATYRRLKQK